ncbi:MAG: hypothetical protein Q8P52_01940 [bacterium]|nr:hypothetical protein [bacterium]
MSKKTATIIIIALIMVLAAVFAFLYFRDTGAKESPVNEDSFPFFPGGGEGSGGEQGGDTISDTSSGETKAVLEQITTTPVAGGIIFTKNSEAYIRYIERALGNVYEKKIGENSTVRVTNTTIPAVYEGLWQKDGNWVLARFTDETGSFARTFYAEIEEDVDVDTPQDLSGTFLTNNIESVSISPDTKLIFYLTSNSGGSLGIVSNPDGSGKREVWRSPIRFWNSYWSSPRTVTLTTKASAEAVGETVLVNTSNGAVRTAILGVRGLTSYQNYDGSYIAFSESSLSSVKFRVLDTTTDNVKTFSLSTLPEKCVWSRNEPNILYCAVPANLPAAKYPDVWYQGRILFSDEIWKLDAENGFISFVAGLENLSGESIDAVNLSLSPDEDMLLFTNKSDYTLWLLRL